jgi:hypothetical protein
MAMRMQTEMELIQTIKTQIRMMMMMKIRMKSNKM